MLKHHKKDYELIKSSIKKETAYFEKITPLDDEHDYSALIRKIYPERYKENGNFPDPLYAVFANLMSLQLTAEGGVFPDCCTERFWRGQLPLVAEVIASIVYYDNQILNSKIEIAEHQLIHNNVRTSRQLQAQLELYIQDEIPLELQSKVRALVYEVLMSVCTDYDRESALTIYQPTLPAEYNYSGDAKWAGQQVPFHLSEVDLKLIHEIFPDFVDKETFVNNYLEKAHLINGFFFEKITNLMLEVLVNPFEAVQKNKLIKFSQFFGVIHHLVNNPTKQYGHPPITTLEILIHHWSVYRQEDATIIRKFAPMLF